jgi:hypothetical protein|tara:strand:+ start:256 stop:672 length:417 start_codon:yes stop_codon:yes gene_type:complete
LVKSFYCCIDSLLPATQPEQHIICGNIANLNNGKIIFYGTEDVLVTKHQPFIYDKLMRTPEIDGVIFFTINQFCYENTLNIDLMNKIIDLRISIHFARENISYFNKKELKKDLPEIYSYYYSFNRVRKEYARNIKKIL